MRGSRVLCHFLLHIGGDAHQQVRRRRWEDGARAVPGRERASGILTTWLIGGAIAKLDGFVRYMHSIPNRTYYFGNLQIIVWDLDVCSYEIRVCNNLLETKLYYPVVFFSSKSITQILKIIFINSHA